MSTIISLITSETISRLISSETIKILAANFNSKNVFDTPVTLGGKIADKKHLVEKTRSTPIKDDQKLGQGIDISIFNMLGIYNDHKGRVNWAFFISIFCSVLAVALLLWTILSASRSDTSIKLIFPLVATFLSGTLFWIYKTEQSKMEAIEKDIRSLDVLKTKINLLSALDDKDKIVSLLKDL
ncbi:MAG: hypothetical protein EOP48_08655 [Sphingobacteriales bacterium]|nr:MAG: hypothetical protein EOP48_08655 [Sphingobacteriales bacterium]